MRSVSSSYENIGCRILRHSVCSLIAREFVTVENIRLFFLPDLTADFGVTTIQYNIKDQLKERAKFDFMACLYIVAVSADQHPGFPDEYFPL